MTASTTDQRRMETAGQSAAAKLLAFSESLTPDEQCALDAALRQIDVRPEESTEDVAGYEQKLNWKPSVVECLVWQEQVRAAVEFLTLGFVTDFTPDCTYMPPPSTPA